MRNSTMTTMTTLGIDLGDRYSHVYALDPSTGEVLGERRVRTRPGEFAELFESMPRVRVVVETGTHANWVARLAERHGHEVLVAQARRLRMIYQNPTKSDAVDARMLAELGSTHPQLLHPVNVRSETTQAHLAQLRARENLVQARTKLINAAKGLVKSMGERLPSCSAAAFARTAAEACPESLEPALAPLLASIAELSQQIRRMERDLEELASTHYAEVTARLREVRGVGPLTSLAFVLVVGDPDRFPRNRDVGAYLGLVPRRDQSGNSDPQRSITRCGDVLMRKLLVQCAQYILGPFGQDCDLRRWGLARAERGGGHAKRRAVVAVARRLAVLLLALWRSDQPYEPLRQAQRSAAA